MTILLGSITSMQRAKALTTKLMTQLVLTVKDNVDRVEVDISSDPNFKFEIRCYLRKKHFNRYRRYMSQKPNVKGIRDEWWQIMEFCLPDNFKAAVDIKIMQSKNGKRKHATVSEDAAKMIRAPQLL